MKDILLQSSWVETNFFIIKFFPFQLKGLKLAIVLILVIPLMVILILSLSHFIEVNSSFQFTKAWEISMFFTAIIPYSYYANHLLKSMRKSVFMDDLHPINTVRIIHFNHIFVAVVISIVQILFLWIEID